MSTRLLLINPNTTQSMTDGMAVAARAAARTGIDGWYDETVAAAAVARSEAQTFHNRDG